MMRRSFFIRTIIFKAILSVGFILTGVFTGVAQAIQSTGEGEEGFPISENHDSTNYGYIVIGAVLLIIVAVVLYRKQYRKFNE